MVAALSVSQSVFSLSINPCFPHSVCVCECVHTVVHYRPSYIGNVERTSNLFNPGEETRQCVITSFITIRSA